MLGDLDWSTSSDNTNLSYLRDYSLGRYIQATKPYKCPADRYLSDVQKQAGWKERVRSVSMNVWLGKFASVNGVWTDGATSSFVGTNYAIYDNDKDFKNLSPAEVWVFIDEHPDDLIPNFFIILPLVPGSGVWWPRLPASYHDGGCVLGFADGHAEVHRWVAPDTRRPVTYNKNWTLPRYADDPRDHDWLFGHATETVP